MLKESYYTEPTEMDTLVFEKLVPPDHYLRRVKQCIDFERFRDLVKDCYSTAMGRTAEDPVRLIKLAFLQFHYNLSDREVVAAAEVAAVARLRQVTADLKDVDRLAHRVAHLRAIVVWADALQHELGPLPASPDKARSRFEAAVALAHRILADRDDPDKGDQVRSVVDP